MLVLAVVLVVWALGTVFVVSLCRAAACGDAAMKRRRPQRRPVFWRRRPTCDPVPQRTRSKRPIA
jgi:hypothetical protein